MLIKNNNYNKYRILHIFIFFYFLQFNDSFFHSPRNLFFSLFIEMFPNKLFWTHVASRVLSSAVHLIGISAQRTISLNSDLKRNTWRTFLKPSRSHSVFLFVCCSK